MKQKNIAIKSVLSVMVLLFIAVVITACNNSYSAGSIASNNQQNTTYSSPGTTNTSMPDETGRTKLSDSSFANNAYLISADTLDASAQNAMSGFSMQKVQNPDGTTTISLTSTNPEYQNQSYTLQSGQQLYFIDKTLGDDTDNQEGIVGDDTAVIVDAQGYIVQ